MTIMSKTVSLNIMKLMISLTLIIIIRSSYLNNYFEQQLYINLSYNIVQYFYETFKGNLNQMKKSNL